MRPAGLLETSVYVNDLAAAKQFYGGVLGLELLAEQPGRHVFFRGGRGVFLVFDPSSTATESTSINGSVLPLHGCTGAGHMAFSIPEGDLEAWRERLAAGGVVG